MVWRISSWKKADATHANSLKCLECSKIFYRESSTNQCRLDSSNIDKKGQNDINTRSFDDMKHFYHELLQ